MNKSDIIDAISKETSLSKSEATKALEAAINTITQAVKGNDKVTIVGFGTFSLSERKERQGRNPQTGETIQIPASKAPKFVAGKAFKELVNS
ncbi:Histone-like bacterial DNA-binding protein [Candidatus Magnetoovum chiemensis]|nr:Histone-like bacterial DNA-binding protein [Candidatus Magnetoovum chiemensis]